MADTELDAMQKISEALADLPPEGRSRVLVWAASRYDVAILTPNARPAASEHVQTSETRSYSDFADMFHAASPQSHAERALVGAFWLAGTTGEPFQSQAVNSLLKDLGFQVPNITDALSQNMREKPALVVQTKKSGSSQQARKLYKLTDAGSRRVKAMLDELSSGGTNG